MCDVLVYVQWGGDTAVWYVFKVFRARLTVDTINTGDRNGLVPPRDVPKRRTNYDFKIWLSYMCGKKIFNICSLSNILSRNYKFQIFFSREREQQGE